MHTWEENQSFELFKSFVYIESSEPFFSTKICNLCAFYTYNSPKFALYLKINYVLANDWISLVLRLYSFVMLVRMFENTWLPSLPRQTKTKVYQVRPKQYIIQLYNIHTKVKYYSVKTMVPKIYGNTAIGAHMRGKSVIWTV